MRLTMGTEKPVCGICSGDLDPTIDDIQALVICGHVFHGFCLHRLVEDAKNKKKKALASCPSCKQGFSGSSGDIIRLFFKFVPDSPRNQDADVSELLSYMDVLAKEARKIEEKMSSYVFVLHNQQAHIDQLNKEISLWKRQEKREDAKIEKITNERTRVQQLFWTQLEELFSKSSNCALLHQKNLKLEKKLLLPPNLATKENYTDNQNAELPVSGDHVNVVNVLESSPANGKSCHRLKQGVEGKLETASMNHEHLIDAGKLSFNRGKRSYKELSAHCELLANAGSTTLKKLDKAKNKMKKLKTKLLELEKTREKTQRA